MKEIAVEPNHNTDEIASDAEQKTVLRRASQLGYEAAQAGKSRVPVHCSRTMDLITNGSRAVANLQIYMAFHAGFQKFCDQQDEDALDKQTS